MCSGESKRGAALTALCWQILEAHRPLIRVGGGAGFMRNLFP